MTHKTKKVTTWPFKKKFNDPGLNFFHILEQNKFQTDLSKLFKKLHEDDLGKMEEHKEQESVSPSGQLHWRIYFI